MQTLPVGDRTSVVITEDLVFGDAAVVIALVRLIKMDKESMMVVWSPICRHSFKPYG